LRQPPRPEPAQRRRAPAWRPCINSPPRRRRLLAFHAWLFAAATDGELDAGAQVHEAQGRQLCDPAIRRALRGAWHVVDPLRFTPGRRDAAAPLAELLALAPVELAEQTRAELRWTGLDPDATGWPPAHG
jgi:hypothetical protein